MFFFLIFGNFFVIFLLASKFFPTIFTKFVRHFCSVFCNISGFLCYFFAQFPIFSAIFVPQQFFTIFLRFLCEFFANCVFNFFAQFRMFSPFFDPFFNKKNPNFSKCFGLFFFNNEKFQFSKIPTIFFFSISRHFFIFSKIFFFSFYFFHFVFFCPIFQFFVILWPILENLRNFSPFFLSKILIMFCHFLVEIFTIFRLFASFTEIFSSIFCHFFNEKNFRHFFGCFSTNKFQIFRHFLGRFRKFPQFFSQ